MMPSTSESLPKLVKFLFAHPGLFELASQNSIIFASFYQITDRPSTLWPGERAPCTAAHSLALSLFRSRSSLSLPFLLVSSLRNHSTAHSLSFPPALALFYLFIFSFPDSFSLLSLPFLSVSSFSPHSFHISLTFFFSCSCSSLSFYYLFPSFALTLVNCSIVSRSFSPAFALARPLYW